MRLLGRKLFNKTSVNCSCFGLKIKWIQKKENRDVNSHEEQEENFGARMDFVDGIKSHVEHDESRGTLHSNSNELACVINSCNDTTCLVTNFCDRTILTQSIGRVSPSLVRQHKMNLSILNNVMTTVSPNEKKDTKTLENVLSIVLRRNMHYMRLQEV